MKIIYIFFLVEFFFSTYKAVFEIKSAGEVNVVKSPKKKEEGVVVVYLKNNLLREVTVLQSDVFDGIR